jgi:hypothetical protein
MIVGTKSATRTSTMVNIKTETDDGNLEVLQQRQMQNEAMASQSSCQTKPSLAGVLCSFFYFFETDIFFFQHSSLPKSWQILALLMHRKV